MNVEMLREVERVRQGAMEILGIGRVSDLRYAGQGVAESVVYSTSLEEDGPRWDSMVTAWCRAWMDREIT